MRPDKKKVVDEVWDQQRIDSFLDKAPMGEEAADYSILLNAYRSMRVEDFEQFLQRYLHSGRKIGAQSRSGTTLEATISSHRHSGPFLNALNNASG